MASLGESPWLEAWHLDPHTPPLPYTSHPGCCYQYYSPSTTDCFEDIAVAAPERVAAAGSVQLQTECQSACMHAEREQTW